MYRQSSSGMMTPGVKNLLLANIAVFIVQILAPSLIENKYFILVPQLVFKKLYLWQLVTYMFLHGGLGHIFFRYRVGTYLGNKRILKILFSNRYRRGYFYRPFFQLPDHRCLRRCLRRSGCFCAVLSRSLRLPVFSFSHQNEISRPWIGLDRISVQLPGCRRNCSRGAPGWNDHRFLLFAV